MHNGVVYEVNTDSFGIDIRFCDDLYIVLLPEIKEIEATKVAIDEDLSSYIFIRSFGSVNFNNFI